MGWGSRRLAVGSNDADVLAWLRRRAAGAGAAGAPVDVGGAGDRGDQRPDVDGAHDAPGRDGGDGTGGGGDDRAEGTELVVASIGADQGGRRALHRALDHASHTWCSSLDRAEVAEAVARYLLDRRAADLAGAWFRLAAVVPARTRTSDRDATRAPAPGGSAPGADAAPGSSPEPVPTALVLAGAGWRERATPALRRAGLAVHPSPLLPLDATTATAPVPASWAFPGDGDHPPRVLRPVVLVADVPSGDDAEVVRSLADAATTRDQAHLDAAASVVAATTGRLALDEPRALARALADVLATTAR